LEPGTPPGLDRTIGKDYSLVIEQPSIVAGKAPDSIVLAGNYFVISTGGIPFRYQISVTVMAIDGNTGDIVSNSQGKKMIVSRNANDIHQVTEEVVSDIMFTLPWNIVK